MVSPAGAQSERAEKVAEGATIGDRYRIESLIDEGAMGRVFLGEHIHMKKRVAIKVLRPELTRVPEVLQRFEREALAAAHIEHPNVASATDFGKLPDGSVYLVLEYVEGKNLRRELEHGPLELARALKIARQVAAALGAAHELDIVHRDLKPENVMLVQRGSVMDHVKVLDFGVAKVPIDMTQPAQLSESKESKPDGALITRAGMVFGTPDYMAPEQALGQPVDGRADLYSLGILLYEMLLGVRPFSPDHELGVLGQQLSTGAPRFAARVPGAKLPSDVETVVLALLAREPSQRPAHAGLVVQQLDGLLTALGDEYSPATMRERMASSRDSSEHTASMHPMAARTGLPLEIGERVKSVLPRPLQGIPTWGVVLLPVTVLVSLAIVLVQATDAPVAPNGSAAPSAQAPSAAPAVTTSPAEPDEAPPLPSAASDAQIEKAVEAGELAVAALLERYPGDARAHVAQARLAKKARNAKAALESIERALELDPSGHTNSHVASALWFTAQKSETEARTLALLEGPMKARGADILFDLAVTEGVKKSLAATARGLLGRPDFATKAQPATAIAAALLLAPSCNARKALLPRASQVGDRRAGRLLQAFRERKGCTAKEPRPCNACLDPAGLAATLAAIEKRRPKAAP